MCVHKVIGWRGEGRKGMLIRRGMKMSGAGGLVLVRHNESDENH